MSNLIISEYLTTSNPSGVTSSPLCVFRFDSTTSSLLDRTGQGRDLVVESGSEVYKDDISSGLVGIDLNGNTLIAANEEALRVAKDNVGGGDASLTFELIFKRLSGTSSVSTCYGVSESLQTNYLYDIGGNNGAYYTAFNEQASGVNINISFTNAENIEDEVFYLVLTVSSDGRTRKIYINGSLEDTVETDAAEKATSGNVQRLKFLSSDSVVFSARLTNEAFDLADVQEVYNSILGEPTPQVSVDDASAYEDNKRMISVGGEDKYKGFSYPDIKVGMEFDGKFSAFEDVGLLPSQGFRRHRAYQSLDAGYIIPGPSLRQSRYIEDNKDNHSLIDDHKFIGAGGSSRHNIPTHGSGVLFETEKGTRKKVCAAEDRYSYKLGAVTDVNRTTTDVHGHAHLLSSLRPSAAYYYNTESEPWTVPTQNSFSGYSKEGYKYTDGVQDIGPVEAPWRTEVSSEYRSPDPAFPDNVLIVAASKELIIYDLDNYDGTAANLVVWIRFMYDDMSHFKALGRGEFSVKTIKMVNGVLIVGTDHNGTENGGVFTIDFKAVDQNVFSLIRSDNHWHANPGLSVVNRNDTGGVYTTTGVDPSLRIDCEYIRSIDAVFDSSDVTKLWVVFSGEDISPEVLTIVNNEVQEHHPVIGDDLGENNVMEDGHRNVYIDDSGWLWFTRGNKIWRNVFDYRYGKLSQNTVSKNIDRVIELPAEIKGLASARNNMFALTTRGAYLIERGSMSFWFAYSLPGYGSGGVYNLPPKGEVLVGQHPVFRHAVVLPTLVSDFLVVSSYLYDAYGGGVTIVRMLDDKAVDSYVYPQLHEDGCFWGLVLPVI